MSAFTVKFSLADSNYFTALRLVAGAVCSASDCDIDALEDFKVCVSESALIFKNCGYEELSAEFISEGGVKVKIKGIGGKAVAGDIDLSLALVSALIADCEIKQKGGIISEVFLKL